VGSIFFDLLKLGLAACAIVALVWLLLKLGTGSWWKRPKGLGKDYLGKPLLTANELEFFNRLRRALPDYYILTQVAMNALMMPAADPRVDKRRFWQIFNEYSRKYVDFVITEPSSMEVLLIVELDDRTHVPEQDEARDAMLNDAGYSVIRWESRDKPTEAEIRDTVIKALRGDLRQCN
jgi:hypothetical protein